MTFLGFLMQLGTAGYLVYLGYTNQYENHVVFLLTPLAFMLGQWMRKHNSRSSRARRSFFNFVGDQVTGYIIGLIATAIFFGGGFAAYHILVLRPAEGSGRI